MKISVEIHGCGNSMIRIESSEWDNATACIKEIQDAIYAFGKSSVAWADVSWSLVYD